MSAPTVSVVMSVYNGAQHLEETLSSVLTQEGCDFEFVIIDDGSTDDTLRILREWAARSARIRVLDQENTGLTRALIRGCAEARGEFIARQDAGDVSLPGRLAAQAAALRGNADAVAVSAHTRFVGPKDEVLFTTAIPEAELNLGLLHGRDGRYYGPAGHGSVMMRRSVYLTVGGYRAAFHFAQDLDLWTRLVEKGRFLVVDAVLFQVRLEPNAISGTQSSEQRRLAELIALATKARRTGRSDAEFLELASQIGPVRGAARTARVAEGNYFIGSCLMKRDPGAAFAYLRSALRARPTHLRSLAKLAACGWRLCISKPNRWVLGEMETELRLPFTLRLVQPIDFPHKLGACERLFGKRLQRSGIRWVRCANGILWKLDLTDSSHRWCVYGDYEGASQMQWIKQWLKHGGHVVDSGANIGQMTLSFLPFGDLTIHAFEPTRSAGDWLESCIRANGLKHVRLVRSGLSSRPARRPIQLNGPRSTLNMDWYRDHGLQTETVNLIRLDDYLNESGIDRIRLWKLDVEGHEVDALTGASHALERKAIDAILIEVSESTLENAKALLRQSRYEIFAISPNGSTRPFVGSVKQTCNLVAMPGS